MLTEPLLKRNPGGLHTLYRRARASHPVKRYRFNKSIKGTSALAMILPTPGTSLSKARTHFGAGDSVLQHGLSTYYAMPSQRLEKST